MAAPPIRQQCWNHESREAVCRCPGCGRSYCRECVTEHGARLLCAACLRKARAADSPQRRAHVLNQSSLSRKNTQSLTTAGLISRNGTGALKG